MTTITIQRVLFNARKELEAISDSAALDVELLLAHCLKKNRTYCHTWPEHELTQSEQRCFEDALKLRKDDYPVAYILGKKSFWTFDVEVTPDVLIPRPETELLVEVALEKIADIKNPKILDLGTGSGVIALALASERPDASIVACDSSKKALEVAQRNAVTLKLDQQIEFIHSDWFENITDKDFDLIVSNPPYIEPNDPHLNQTIRHEPYSALVADDLGMRDIHHIIEYSKMFLKPIGLVILEHGYDQHLRTQSSFTLNDFIEIESKKDLAENIRITLAATH
ncbi:peptide chain release factor N(5)-glutamine methyltransferase [uncultured Cocleimonas sp.]|uniref:peptide chain release factor N(5)-glutamine methyltransferase n=1 Tax=uncultured Cocleimonas sp. TaxID=1051587 RepID=UPI0026326AE7|nr:peptide chain release factor N(5)-glutamine methyltransferase [uncultured Cocleimonas sp.]